jgi:YggT family protein
VSLLILLLELYTYVIFGAVILSWVPSLRENPIGRGIEAVTEPVFAQVRKLLPPLGGMDLSPILVLVTLGILKRLLRG